jgi:hypothetical protein
MSLVSDAVSAVATPIKPYLLAIKIAAIVGAVSLIGFLSWRVHVDGQQIGALKVTVAQAQADNKADMNTINQLRDANAEWVAQDAANKAKIDELTTALSDQQHSLDASRLSVQNAQSAETAPSQVSLRSTRIDGADDQLAQRLRNESAANSH